MVSNGGKKTRWSVAKCGKTGAPHEHEFGFPGARQRSHCNAVTRQCSLGNRGDSV